MALGEPVTFSCAAIHQAFPELKRIHKFAVEYFQDGHWQPCCQGTNPAEKFSDKFAPLTAQRVRLNPLEATGGPTIWEFQLLESSRFQSIGPAIAYPDY